MKRKLLILFIILFVSAGGFYFLTKDKIIFEKETSLYKAVPVSAPLFIELNALKSVPVDNPLVKELLGFEKDVLFLRKVSFLDSLIQNNKDIQKGLRNESLVLAFDFVGESDIYPLVISRAAGKNKQKYFEKFLAVLYPLESFSHSKREYSDHEIETIKSSKDKDVLHFCFTDGLFIASPKVLLVEKCIRQLNTQSITENLFFTQVNKSVMAQSKITLYINHQTFPELAALWLNTKSTISTNEFNETVRESIKNKFKNFRNFAAWSQLDVELDEQEVVLNGISTADDSLNHFLSVFEGQEAVRFHVDKILPANTSFYTSYSFSDKSLFFVNLERYFEHTNSFYKREDRIKKIERGFRIGFKRVFQELVKNELIVATTSISSKANKKSTLFILVTGGADKTKTKFNSLFDTYARRKKIELKSLKSVFKADDENKFTVYKFPYPSFPGIWLGKPFEIAQAQYATFYENNLVFSNTERGLQDYLLNMVSESTLSRDHRYVKFKRGINSRSNINSYVNVKRVFRLKDEIFNAKLAKELEAYETYIRKFQAVNWQVAWENGKALNSIYLSLSQTTIEDAETEWQVSLDNRVASKPQLVVNHRDLNNKEIVVQDSENNFYQINKDGQVNWSVSIDGPILGRIHQIDYFKNGRLQYLFNTKDKLYLIDRTGKKVGHFPISFTSPATNGVNVFDYDKIRKYRYFVAFEDKKVIAFDGEGKVLSGWKFGKTNGRVTTPIQHFRVKNKDYIVFKDDSNIYIQTRSGETRVKVDVKIENSQNAMILDLNGIPKIVTTDNTGKVYYIYFDGKVEERKTAKFSEGHFFLSEDIDNNGVADFIFVDKKELVVFNENGKKLFSEKFKNRISNPPVIFTFSSNEKKIGVVEASANQIHLFNKNGKEHHGFPLQGNSSFCIGQISKGSEKLNLIVSSKTGDLYNYTLN